VRRLLLIVLLACAAAAAQQVPRATDLPSHPFFIKATWYIGGAGTWDYMTFDRDANRLYIAHGTEMQVVDVETGLMVGAIKDFYEARQVALDDTGQYGYVSDGGQGKVVVFDRQTLKRVVDIDTGANPRWIVFDPLTHLVFVVRANPPGEAPPAPPPTVHRRNTGLSEPPPPSTTTTAPKPPAQQQESNIQSFVTVIDGQTQTALGEIKLTGQVGYAVVDEGGQLFIALPDRNQVARIDDAAIAAAMRPPPPAEIPASATAETPVADSSGAGTGATGTAEPKETPKPKPPPFITLDWTGTRRNPAISDGRLRVYAVGPDCNEPRALAIDERHLRIFAACTNRTLEVLNTGTGEKVASLPIGPGADAVGYDQDHGLIFTANGAAEGSLTIIRQDVTDSYNVVQTLPTRQRANILAVNPSTGDVYLVTDFEGVDLSQPGGIGTLREKPIEGSFQVVRVEN
jgi:DNA-binding beta-propeller fold protein YncE